MSKIPSVATYRLKPSDIDHSTCLGRVMGHDDKRWYPAVYREAQCGKKVTDGNNLCATCQRRKDTVAADYAPSEIPTKILNTTRWCGMVTGPVSEYQHTAGTKWANGLLEGQENPVWIGKEAATLNHLTRKAIAADIRAGMVPTLSVEEASAPDLAAAFSALVAALKGSGKTVKITIELSS